MTSSCIPAHALTLVRDYKGPCMLVVSKRSIGVSTENENLGTWPFECIRRFHSQELNYFSFTSGRRGPYGVCDYTFRMKDEDLKKLQDILSQCTGAKFDSPRGYRSGSASSSSSSDSTPHHTPLHYSHVSTLSHTTQPGYTTMTIPGKLPDDMYSRGLSPKVAPLSPSPLSSPVSVLNRHQNKDYDKLENAKQEATSILDGISLIKQESVDQNGQEDSASDHSQNLSKQEIRQIKQFNKEPLVNKSPIVHVRRNVQYTDIDLPDSGSEDGSSRPTSNQYDSSSPLISSIYDVPPPAIPLVQNTYDIPSSVLRQSVENEYGVPRSTKSPLQRALPHLPTDYENVSPPAQKIVGNRAYVNVGRGETGLYMEVPLDKIQSRSMINIYNDMPERLESQLTIRRVESDKTTAGERLAKELAEEGYEFVKPALLPALMSPPPSSIEPVLEVPNEEQEADEYVEVRRSNTPPVNDDYLKVTSNMPGRSKRGIDGYEVVDDKLRRATVHKPHVDDIPRCRRWSDGYEDITDVMKELQPETTSQKTDDSPINSPQVVSDASETPLVTTKELQEDNTGDDDDDDVYISMHSANPPPDKSSPLLIPKRAFVPTALGSPDAQAILLRKRSLTIGDPLDNNEAKKHTYVNVPDDSGCEVNGLPQRSFTAESVKKKPPMPLPRPASSKDVIIDSTANVNHSNNKVQSLVRQFSNC